MVTLNGKNKMLTAAEVAGLLHVHINTVRRWSDRGLLTSYRIGTRGDRRFYKDDITQFLHGNGNGNSGNSQNVPSPIQS